MMTVRSPGGQFYTYNEATYVTRSQHGYADLYTKQGGRWLAQVPNDWLIEVVTPCVVGAAPSGRQQALDMLLNNGGRELRQCSGFSVARLKRLLADFHLQRQVWMR